MKFIHTQLYWSDNANLIHNKSIAGIHHNSQISFKINMNSQKLTETINKEWRDFLDKINNVEVSNSSEKPEALIDRERRLLKIMFVSCEHPLNNQDNLRNQERKVQISEPTIKELQRRDNERIEKAMDIEPQTLKGYKSDLYRKFEVNSYDGLFYKLKSLFVDRLGTIKIEYLWQRLWELGKLTTTEMGLELKPLESPKDIKKKDDRIIEILDFDENSYSDTITINRKYKICIHFSQPVWLILLNKDSFNHVDNIAPSENCQAKINNSCDGIYKIPEQKNRWIGSKELGRNELWALVISQSDLCNQKAGNLSSIVKKSFEDKNHILALQEILSYIEDSNNLEPKKILCTSYTVK